MIDINKDLLHNQNSIIHQKVFSQKGSSVILYAIDDNETIAEHQTRNNEFIYVLDGQIELIVNNKSTIMSKGSFYLIGANNLHTVNGYNKGKFALIILKNRI
ncbi:MAG: cupin domain-containing protein [Epsilonproteobacteria bacterium]|nr:cupin domain-containing protein [Campylobacterota bacterium]